MNPSHSFAIESSMRFAARRKAMRRGVAGFTLVEILVVLTIMAIMLSILIMSISGVKGSRDLGRAAYDIQGVLEQARTTAMATGTYTWVGFFEEDPTAAATSPQTSGKGQLVVALVSSKDGTNLSTQVVNGKLPPTVLNEVTKLMKIPNVHVNAALPATATTTRPTATYEVDPSAASGTVAFDYPIGAATPAYTFKRILQFNPQGDVMPIYGAPSQVTEIGLQPAHGNVVPATGTNAAAIQVAGIGGQVITYRP